MMAFSLDLFFEPLTAVSHRKVGGKAFPGKERTYGIASPVYFQVQTQT